MQGHAHGYTLIHIAVELKQPAGDRDSERFGPEFPAIFQSEGCGHGAPKVDAGSADFSSVGEVGHYSYNYGTVGEILLITKAGFVGQGRATVGVQQLS